MSKRKEIMKDLQKLFFPVHKERAEDFYKTKGVDYLPGLDHVIVVTQENGRKMVVNSCSEIYEVVPMRELLEPFITKMLETHDLKVVQAQVFTHSKFFVNFTLEDAQAIKMGNGKSIVDTIVPMIRVNNSYDGTIKYSYEGGFWRVVCSNGAKVPVEGSVTKQKVMHTPGAKESIEKTVGSLEKFIEKAKELSEGYDPLIDQKLSRDGAIKRMEEVVEDLEYPKKNLETAIGQFNKEVGMGLPINDWLVYNALNYGLYNTEESALVPNKADNIDHKVLHYLITQ